MKRKIFPIALMLLAGAIAAIISYKRAVGLIPMCWATLISMIIFFAMGSVIRYIMEKFEEENEKRLAEEKEAEGEVIEKELTDEEKMREQAEARGASARSNANENADFFGDEDEGFVGDGDLEERAEPNIDDLFE